MRFRLFRSRAFWLGVPGLVFLLWAWGDSLRTVREAYFYRQGLLLWHGDSRLIIHILSGHSWVPGGESGIGFDRHPAGSFNWPCLPVPMVDKGGWCDASVQMPHWLMALIYGAVWTALLVWRAGRFRQALQKTGAS